MRRLSLFLALLNLFFLLLAGEPAAVRSEPRALAAALRLAAVSGVNGSGVLPSLLARRALAQPGSLSALRSFMSRFTAGEKLVVAVIGGSVTVGNKCGSLCSSHPTYAGTWSRRVFDALVAASPHGVAHNLTYVNGAVPSTGAPFFAACIRHRVPDDAALVLLEFAINSGGSHGGLAGIEGVVRRLLARSPPPAVVLVDWFPRWPGNSRVEAKPGEEPAWARRGWYTETGCASTSAVAEHYDVPRVSMRAALLADDAAGTQNLRYEDFGADWSHPNAKGHAFMAQAVVGMIAKALEHDAHPRVAGVSVPAAAAALFSGGSTAVASLPPLAPGNRAEELAPECLFGDDLRAAVAAAAKSNPPRAWFYDTSDPMKPGFRADVNASDADWSANSLSLRFRAFQAATLVYSAGWDTADAAVTCGGNCSCDTSRISAGRPVGRVMEQSPIHFHKGGLDCEVTLKAVADGTGRKGFKVMALIAGGPDDTDGELYFGVDSITGDGREKLAYGTIAG